MTEQGIIPTLNSCSLRFANVQDLNDTYEFPFISENLRKSEVNILVHKFRNEGLSSIGKKIFSKCNDNIDSVIDEITNFSRKMLEEQYDKTVEFTKKNHAICCFSEVINNPAIWGYYAGNSTGAAIGFSSDLAIIEMKKVNYVDVPPTFHPVYCMGKGYPYVKLLITKSKHWAHEQEQRLILPKYALVALARNEQYKNFLSKDYPEIGFLGDDTEQNKSYEEKHLYMYFHAWNVKEVCFGVNATDSFKEKTLSILNEEHYSHVNIFQMMAPRSSYDLEKISINKNN